MEKKIIDEPLEISVVIPAFNEEENIEPLYTKLKKTLQLLDRTYEIILVDDGSSDATLNRMVQIHRDDNRVKIIKFRRNYGQTAALDAGFKEARGTVVVSMDGDMQNESDDIPKLLTRIAEGYDVVSGWRRSRNDSLSKRFISRGANVLRKIFFRDHIHDSGCTLRAYKKECLDGLNIFGEMHRFIPAILEWKGFKIAEVEVMHHHRKHGRTKYNLMRTIRGFLDIIIVYYWMKYSVRPMHLFGPFGILSILAGFSIMLYLTIIKIVMNVSIAGRPLLILGVMLFIVGFQLLFFGMIADVLIKIYYRDEMNYSIEKVYQRNEFD